MTKKQFKKIWDSIFTPEWEKAHAEHLASLPPEQVIIDHGSSPETLKWLRMLVSDSPKQRKRAKAHWDNIRKKIDKARAQETPK